MPTDPPYTHTPEVHSVVGARRTLEVLLAEIQPTSLLDVGCGTGTWVRAALDLGIHDTFCIDGVDPTKIELLIDPLRFHRIDLKDVWNLGRRFDLALCLEVAEHLDESSSEHLVNELVKHSDTILFSAACPGQPGQNHVNCQWPEHWQGLFNRFGFVCSDDIRWRIWNDPQIECWYRQNIFIARHNPSEAGCEPRIQPVIHPEMASTLFANIASARAEEEIRGGHRPLSWYAETLLSAISGKVLRGAARTTIKA